MTRFQDLNLEKRELDRNVGTTIPITRVGTLYHIFVHLCDRRSSRSFYAFVNLTSLQNFLKSLSYCCALSSPTMRLKSLITGACWVSAVSAAFDLNRGGGVLKAPEGDSFASVSGTFTVPNLSGSNRLSIWVGIGDSLQQDYVLGGGIVYNSTLKSFSAYWPGPATDTTSTVPVASGNSVTVTVTTAEAGGTVTVENKTQNKKTTQSLSAPTGVDPSKLTALVANWFVQAYQVTPGELVRTPNFGTVSFTACTATTRGGVAVPITGAGRYEIQGTSGQMYSATTISSTGISVRRQA